MASSKEGVKHTHSLSDFKGVNTQSARQNIGDDEFGWLENVVPIGAGNLRTVLAPSGAIRTATPWPGTTAYYMKSVNLNGQDLMFVFTTDGACYYLNLENTIYTKLAPAGTFAGFGTDIAQWSNTQICFIDPAGYFTYDGFALTNWEGTIANLTITSPGNGYTTIPTISISAPGGGGTTATASTDLQVVLGTLVAAGTGYEVNDVLSVSGGTLGPDGAATFEVSAIGSGGSIAGLNLTFTGDYTVIPSTSPNPLTGGFGSGATVTLNFGIGPITLVSQGTDYTSAPTVTITGGGGSGATVIANLRVVPPSGTAIATYAGRVWVAANRTVSFSAPGSYNDFSSGNAGGSFVISDETLLSYIVKLVSANDYLYIFGTSSIDILSGVQVVSGITVFSETNISSSIGSGSPGLGAPSSHLFLPTMSIVPYYRSLAFSTTYGFYVLSGTTPQKISDHLDGIFPLINNGQNIPISAGTVVINNAICLAFMFKYNDPFTENRTLIAVLINKKWFFVSQGNSLTMMATAIVDGAPTLYASDGNAIYELLENSVTPLTIQISTKLWDMGEPTTDKQVLKVGVEESTYALGSGLIGTVYTEVFGTSANFNPLENVIGQVNWVNESNQIVQWQNTSFQNVFWLQFIEGYYFAKADVETTGKYIGVNIIGDAPGEVFSAIHLQYEYRAKWTTMPT